MADSNRTEAETESSISIDSLPLPSIVHDKSGAVLALNAAAEALLGIVPGTPASQLKILHEYLQPLADEVAPTDVVRIQSGPCHRYVKCVTGQITPDPRSPFLTCITDYHDEYRLKRLFQNVPLGVYEVDEAGNLAQVNAEAAKMFGFDSPEQMRGQPVRRFYANPADEERVSATLRAEGKLTGQVLDMVKNNGDQFVTKIYTTGISHRGRGRSREGAILDVTDEEQYRRVLEDVPLGFYRVRYAANGEDQIIQCNDAFADMFDFQSRSQVIGTDIRSLYDLTDDHEIFRTKLAEADKHGKTLIAEPLAVKSLQGKHFNIEVWCRAIHAAGNDTIVGRLGVVKRSEEHEMRLLIQDIGILLHPYTGFLQRMSHYLSGLKETMQALVEEVSREVVDADDAQQAAATALLRELRAVLAYRSDVERAGAFAEEVWIDLENASQALATYRREIPFAELHPPALRLAGLLAWAALRQCRGRLPRETLRRARTSARDLVCTTWLVDIDATRDSLRDMDHQTRGLREYLVSRVREEEPLDRLRVSDLVAQAIRDHSAYASERKVEITPRRPFYNGDVLVHRDDVVRALGSLLHNAIKYSWDRRVGRPWVDIEVGVDGPEIVVSFENYGVPVAPEEIANGTIFRIGHRGRLSGDKGRLGTGIGLADARAVARKHGGDVQMESRPAVESSGPATADTPFITTVRFRLPLHQ